MRVERSEVELSLKALFEFQGNASGALVLDWAGMQMAFGLTAGRRRRRQLGGASVREVILFPKGKGQAVCPPAVSTDAQPGYSVMVRQSAEILYGSCQGDGSILVHLEGSSTRARPSTVNELAQGAKVGFCSVVPRRSASRRRRVTRWWRSRMKKRAVGCSGAQMVLWRREDARHGSMPILWEIFYNVGIQ